MNDPEPRNIEKIDYRDLDLPNSNVNEKPPEKFTSQFAKLAILEDILVEEISIDGMCGIY